MRLFRFKGIAVIQKGAYPQALSVFQQYAVIAEKIGSIQDIGNSYTYIGYCHRAMEDIPLAFQYAKKSVQLLKDTPYKAALANNYTTYSSYYSTIRDNLDSALIYAKLARQLYKEANNPVNEAITTFDIAENFNLLYQADSAIYYVNQAKPFVLSQKNNDMLAHYHIRLGEAFYIKGSKKEALHHLRIGSKLAVDVDNPKFAYVANKFLTLALALDGQTIESIKCMEETADGFAEHINIEKIRDLNTAQLNFEFEKKQALASLELHKQKRIRDISLVGLFLGLIVALLLFRLYRLSKRSARLLAIKNAQIEKSYQELKATQEQLILTEKQREAQSIRVNIARDIHDELGAGLTKITMMSDFVRKKLPVEQGEIAQMLQRITENSKGVSDALGEIVWAVNPSHDTLESLSSYLKNYSAHYLEGTGIKGEYDFPINILPRNVEPALKRNVFLVLKEALNNAVKYAKADTIWVTFVTDGNTFKLSIRDNGVGFNPEEKSQNGGSGNGLVNMKKRMELLGCQYNIQSEPGKGCTVTAFGTI